MHLIAYISEHTGDAASVDQHLAEIVTSAKRRNLQLGITGVLFYHVGKFIQVIEGEEPNLREVMALIEADTRHRNLSYLIDVPVDQRGFSDWNMDSFNLTRKETLDVHEMHKISAAYRAMLIPRSNTLVDIYQLLLEEGIFRQDAPAR